MFKVVNESKGTAYNSRSASAPFAGKTGTSQVRRITVAERESEDFRKKELEWKKEITHYLLDICQLKILDMQFRLLLNMEVPEHQLQHL